MIYLSQANQGAQIVATTSGLSTGKIRKGHESIRRLVVSGDAEFRTRQPEESARTSHHDLQTTIRRLEATNKDLSTSNAGILALNDKLLTENRQLQARVVELESSNHAAIALRCMADSLEERVRQSTAQLRALNAELTLTEDRERRILARDLHDDLGQVLAIVKIKLSAIEGSERRGMLKAALKDIEQLIDQANRSVRSLMLQLSPPILQTLGLIPALEWLAEEMERLYGLVVHIDSEGKLPNIAEPARTTVFRSIRELLINVAKHAKTPRAQVFCHPGEDGLVCLSVTDQGHGFNYQETLGKPVGDAGFGLLSVRERIEFIGGRMDVDSQPGYGTTISIIFPGEQESGSQGGGNNDHSGDVGR